jgi:periplasmic protein TonB
VSSYTAADQRDRWKAIVGAIAVNAVLGVMIVTGLNVRFVGQAVERLVTINVREPPPPPPVKPPPPAPKPQQMKKPAGAPAPKATPTPIVAPQPKLPVPSPIPAAKVAGAGSASSSGAGTSGTGTGAGGAGYGPGGGGYGGFMPAQKITKIPDHEYRRLVSLSGMDRGTVGLTIKVTPDGSASNCRIVRSSGSPPADALMCQLTEEYVRFRPARDASGRPVAQDVTWYPNWWRPGW